MKAIRVMWLVSSKTAMKILTGSILLAILIATVTSRSPSKDDVQISPEDANSFMVVKSRVPRGIYHECYHEGCDFEEVEEVFGASKKGYEYYYTYTCHKFGRNCKVPCTYREDCTFGEWGTWRGVVNAQQPGCYPQIRSKPYNHPLQTQYRRFSCGGLNIGCPAPPVQRRRQCVCRKANCQHGSWEEWTGNITEGSCGMQNRIRPYTLTWSLEQQTGSCNSVPTECPIPETDYRKMCSCPKADCALEDWGEWKGSVAEGTCGQQKRTRGFTKSIVYEQHVNECPANLPQKCPQALEETRTNCSCKYATCSLGDWSEWEPKELQEGQCGQQQTRKKTYALTFQYQMHADKCPPLPQTCPDDIVDKRTQCKCRYRDSCDLKPWSEWENPITEEGCEIQTRTRDYVHPLKHSLQEDCSGLLTSCVTKPKESRNFCKCKYVECDLGEWSDWSSPALAPEQCGKEKRTREYIAKEKFSFGETCDGLVTSCPAAKEETRTICKCAYVSCKISDWNPWKGELPKDGCAQQIRTKDVTTTQHEKIQAENCQGLQTTCPEVPPETRTWCNCSFREDCVLKEWSAWSEKIPDVGCAVQIRKRDFNKSLEWIERGTCDGLESCRAIREEARTECNCNQIICSWGNWTRKSFNAETNCFVEMRVKNESDGFKKIRQADDCKGIPTRCRDDEKEEREDCLSGGPGGKPTTTAPPTRPPTTVAPTTAGTVKPPTFVHIGCFKDKGKDPRPLPMLIANKRKEIDWYNLRKTVEACAAEAQKSRYEYFSVQFFGECWSGENAGKTFAKDGVSKDCYEGVGKNRANAVYRIEDIPPCSSELSITARASSGQVRKNNAWCAGRNSDKFQWIIVDLDGEKKISGVGTQGVDLDNWVTLYTVQWSEDGEAWVTYQEDGHDKIFTGNSDRFTLETRWLKDPITASFLRFVPKSWSSILVCMKIRVYGCNV